MVFQLSLVLAVAFIGRALQISNGAWHPDAFTSLAMGFLSALLPLVIPARPVVERFASRAVMPVAAAALALQFGFLSRFSPGIYLRPGPGMDATHFHLGIAAAVVIAAMALADPRQKRIYPALILTLYFGLGVWVLQASPAPWIDVWHIHQRSAQALLGGTNPYTITFPNIYGHTQYFAPGTATATELLFGYVYPPWDLLLGLPGYLLAKDYRYAYLAALAGAGALMAFGTRTRMAAVAVALFLFTSRSFFVLEQGWTEPALVLPLAAAVFFALRRKLVPLAIALGVLGVAKQYSILAAPAVFVLRPLYSSWRAFLGSLGLMALAGGVVTLPLVLWDFGAFWHNVFGMQFSMPFRPDSLSAPVWWLHRFGTQMPRILQLGLPLFFGLAVLWRAPKTAAGFAWAAGTLYFLFFMSRQGFANYYFLVIAAYCMAIAAWPSAPNEPTPSRPDHDRPATDSLDSARL